MILNNKDNKATQDYTIAVLFDCENISSVHIPFIFKELERFGRVVLKRAFKDWSRQSDWQQKVIEKYGMTPIQVFRHKYFKNTSDLRIQANAFKILYESNIDIICIVSSDSDFRDIALAIQAKGKKSIGFGEQKTPLSLQKAYTHFICLKSKNINKEIEIYSKNNIAKNPQKQESEISILQNAIYTLQDDSGFCNVSRLANYLCKQNANYTLKGIFRAKKWTDVFRRYKKILHYEYIGHNNRILAVRLIS